MNRCRRSSACQTSPMSSLQHKNKPLVSQRLPPLDWVHKNVMVMQTHTLTVVYWDAGALVRCQDEAAATATQKAAHCVDALMVTHVAAWVLTLINVCVFEREHKRKISSKRQIPEKKYLIDAIGQRRMARRQT